VSAYITSIGKFLPGEAVPSERIEEYIGAVGRNSTELRDMVIKNSGIRRRHYAIDRDQRTVYSNVEMCRRAIEDATERRGISVDDVGLLVASTSAADLLGPSHATMLHGELWSRPAEILSVSGLCCSGMGAMKAAWTQVEQGRHPSAIVSTSELVSRLFKSSQYAENGLDEDGSLDFDVAFLRYMLSDAAAASIVEDRPAPAGLSLRIEWISVTSYAHSTKPCMYVGSKDQSLERTWQDYPTFGDAARDGAMALRQDMRLLPRLVKTGADEYVRLSEAGMIDADEIDHVAVHYSSETLRPFAQREFARRGLDIREERWFSNLSTVGNVGCAAIYLILEEMLASGRIEEGQKVLCFVPESGRFTISFMLLTAVGPDTAATGGDGAG
jgi:3-oxoacyl-[acyl-carrier-protein] synthase-3